MNTILQQRIFNLAKEIVNYNLVDLGDLTNSNDLFKMLLEMGSKVLSHQWISVDEALPPYDDRLKEISIDVIVRNEYGKATSAWYDYANKVWHLLYGEIAGDDVLDSKITHWAEIPKFNK